MGGVGGRMRHPLYRQGKTRFSKVRALLRADAADDQLARALARAGLYVERVPDLAAARERLGKGDVALIDPALLPALAGRGEAPAPAAPAPSDPLGELTLEELCYRKLARLLDKLGSERLPALHATVVAQAERALVRLALERTGALANAAELLGIHRNTLARRLGELGLRTVRKSR